MPHPQFQSLANKVEEVMGSPQKTGHYWVTPRWPQDLLFLFGGFLGSKRPPIDVRMVSSISVFDPTADNWRNLPTTLLDNWSSMGSLVVGTDIYLCGGQMIKEGLSPVKVLMRFSANTMEVTRLSMMRDCSPQWIYLCHWWCK